MKKIIAILLFLIIFFGGIVAAQPVEDTSKKEDIPTLGDTFDKGLIFINNMLELGIKNSQKEFNINPLYKYYANWTFNGGNVSIEPSYGDDVWSYGVKITTGEQTGITTVTVKDQTGKSMSFDINVT